MTLHIYIYIYIYISSHFFKKSCIDSNFITKKRNVDTWIVIHQAYVFIQKESNLRSPKFRKHNYEFSNSVNKKTLTDIRVSVLLQSSLMSRSFDTYKYTFQHICVSVTRRRRKSHAKGQCESKSP